MINALATDYPAPWRPSLRLMFVCVRPTFRLKIGKNETTEWNYKTGKNETTEWNYKTGKNETTEWNYKTYVKTKQQNGTIKHMYKWNNRMEL